MWLGLGSKSEGTLRLRDGGGRDAAALARVPKLTSWIDVSVSSGSS